MKKSEAEKPNLDFIWQVSTLHSILVISTKRKEITDEHDVCP